ncbi:MAG: cytochrome P460 family protein [Lysobacter sp.]
MRAERNDRTTRGYCYDLGYILLAGTVAVVMAIGSIVQAEAASASGQTPNAPATGAGADIAYPAGYSMWTHIKSGLITPGHAAFPRFGGLHHIYANTGALQGYRNGRYPDGSVLVYDLFETRDSGDGIVDQGPRRHIDVMIKDSRRFPATGGWGYAEFAAGSRSDRLKTVQRDDCAACHATREKRGYVFSEWQNAGDPAATGS